jgi:predicted MFS family arabinose efflux permease
MPASTCRWCSRRSAVTAYLLGGAAGIVAGGFLAVRTTRHDRVASVGLLGGAALVALVATGAVPRPLIVPLFVVIGVVLGATGRRCDLIVRNATPKRAPAACTASSTRGSTSARRSAHWFGLMLDHHLGARDVLYDRGAAGHRDRDRRERAPRRWLRALTARGAGPIADRRRVQ